MDGLEPILRISQTLENALYGCKLELDTESAQAIHFF
jgi:hypothetical protein